MDVNSRNTSVYNNELQYSYKWNKGNSSSFWMCHWTCSEQVASVVFFSALSLHALLALVILHLKAQFQVKSQVISAVASLFCLVRNHQICDKWVWLGLHGCGIRYKQRKKKSKAITNMSLRTLYMLLQHFYWEMIQCTRPKLSGADMKLQALFTTSIRYQIQLKYVWL